MHFNSKIIFITFLLGISAVLSVHLLEIIEKSSKVALCGGSIDADSESIVYPGAGDKLEAGNVCVWTIHLETARDFKFNFTNLNVSSSYNDCRDGGVRIYALTNLVPSDRLESYTFCDKSPFENSFYLGYNVAVVVLYIGSSNSNPGSGFTLNWEGNAFDPMRTKHVSSFSNSFEGIIRYPITGHYSPNVAATWLIKSITAQQTTRSDLTLNSISLESCSNPQNICTCDALIFYEISPSGFLNETRRFCRESSGEFFQNVESRFLLAFFTDFETQLNGGGGFEIIYYPSESTTTEDHTTPEETTPEETETPETETPETETPETETPDTETPDTETPDTETPETETPDTETTTFYPYTTPGPSYSTKCGGVLKGTEGIISYKAGQPFNSNERCVWTIVTPFTKITFNLLQSGFGSDLDDGISISMLQYSVNPILDPPKFLRVPEGPLTFTGIGAIVTFISDALTQGSGFVLSYESSGTLNSVSPYSSHFIVNGTGSGWFYGSLSHPTQGQYSNDEISTFVISLPEFRKEPYDIEVHTELKVRALEVGCYDFVFVYKFDIKNGWLQETRICDSPSSRQSHHVDMLLFVFYSDRTGTDFGFDITWVYNLYVSTTWSPK